MTENHHAISSDDSEMCYAGGYNNDFHTQPRCTPSASSVSDDEEDEDEEIKPPAKSKRRVCSDDDSYGAEYQAAPKKQAPKARKASLSPQEQHKHSKPIPFAESLKKSEANPLK